MPPTTNQLWQLYGPWFFMFVFLNQEFVHVIWWYFSIFAEMDMKCFLYLLSWCIDASFKQPDIVYEIKLFPLRKCQFNLRRIPFWLLYFNFYDKNEFLTTPLYPWQQEHLFVHWSDTRIYFVQQIKINFKTSITYFPFQNKKNKNKNVDMLWKM